MNEDVGSLESIISLENLSHYYGKKKALDNISLRLPAGLTIGLIGPDGVGKSTFLSLIAGVKEIQEGKLLVLGEDITSQHIRSKLYNQIAFMPQGLGKNLYQSLSVYENIDFFGRLFGLDRRDRQNRIRNLLISTSLDEFSDRPMEKLSGGMKQKLGLCCALIHEPLLLILDEPTTGVDPLSRRQFWQLIENIRSRNRNISVIVATAYMEEAEEFDLLIAMDEGRILATGTPEDIKSKTESESLEEAFINLLPESKKREHIKFRIEKINFEDRETEIKANALTKKFGEFTAVNNVSFRIKKGEIFGFVGSNGCGKTTTMKMLTGLLPVTSGEVELLGRKPETSDLDMRRRVGYMSQSFSLYSELTVLQNLELHARLFHLPQKQIPERIDEIIKRMELEGVTDQKADDLPLGIKQRLSLAVAIIHFPELLILDEPTSGVDPVARDKFWELLINLSRSKGVTIFISTHFMNEAERCDRISLMHAGEVLATGTPEEIMRSRDCDILEDAFVSYLSESSEGVSIESNKLSGDFTENLSTQGSGEKSRLRYPSLNRLWAFVIRESIEITRDPVRLLFALMGPVLLLVVFGYGISFDVENLPYAVLDRDRTPESRIYLENFSGSRYFTEHKPIEDYDSMDNRLRSGELRFGIEIPPKYGENLKSGSRSEVGIWLEGGFPYRAELARNYILGVQNKYLSDLKTGNPEGSQKTELYDLDSRFRYNQDLKSASAIVPGIIAMLLAVIPSILTAVGVVREKELGSITNLYSTPASRLEFLVGKQLPYVAIGLLNFFSFILLAMLLFSVDVKGSFLSLLAGSLIFVIASTGFGLLVSAFTSTQIAALVGTFLITMINSMMFSGFLQPVSSLVGAGKFIAITFPTTYFMKISMGIFTKALSIKELYPNYFYIIVFAVAYLCFSTFFMRRQEK